MKNKTYALNALLAAVLAAAMTAAIVVKTFNPAAVMPKADVPNLVLISLTALLLDHYLAPGARRCYICIPLFSVVTFGLLGWAAGADGVLKLAVMGGGVFTAVTWLFSSIADRLSTGPKAGAAVWMGALCLYLSSLCFAGMF